MQNNRETVDSFVHMWLQLSGEQRRALLNPDNLARVKAALNIIVDEEAKRTFFTPLNDGQAEAALVRHVGFTSDEAKVWVQRVRRISLPGSLAWIMRAGYDFNLLRSGSCWFGDLPNTRKLYNCGPTSAGLVFWNPGMSTPCEKFQVISETQMPWLGERFGPFRVPDPLTLMGLLEAWAKQSGGTVKERLLTAAHTGAATGESYVIEHTLDGGRRYRGDLEELDAPGIKNNIFVTPVLIVPLKDR